MLNAKFFLNVISAIFICVNASQSFSIFVQFGLQAQASPYFALQFLIGRKSLKSRDYQFLKALFLYIINYC